MDHSYLWLKALHIISFIAWMAGMLYLPRLYVYHADAPKGGELSETLKTMEQRLLRIIMNPAMIATFGFGLALVFTIGWEGLRSEGWFHAKVLLVLLMAGLHGFLAKCRSDFARDENKRTAKFYRVINEVPTALMIAIVLLVVLRPF